MSDRSKILKQFRSENRSLLWLRMSIANSFFEDDHPSGWGRDWSELLVDEKIPYVEKADSYIKKYAKLPD